MSVVNVRLSAFFASVSALLALSCFITTLVLSVRTVRIRGDTESLVVVDCGSSGTRAILFSWPRRAHAVQPVTQVTATASEIYAGVKLSGFASNPNDVSQLIDPIIAWSKSLLGEREQTVPLFVGATAGMRLLPEKTQHDIIFALEKRIIETSRFVFVPGQARVISGQEEGVFGWVAVNYMLGVLFDETRATVGAVDCGGASVQLTLDLPMAPTNSKFAITLAGRSFMLFSTSHLGLGMDQGVAQVGILVAQNKSETADPCYPVGYNASGLLGSGDYAACRSYAKSVVQGGPNTTCAFSTCGPRGTYQPSVQGRDFIFFSSFWNTFGEILQMSKSSFVTSANDLAAAALQFCQHNAAWISSNIPENILKYAWAGCADATFLTALTVQGFHFPGKQRFTIQSDVAYGWALGMAIYEAQLVPFESQDLRKRALHTQPFRGDIIALWIVVIVSTLATVFFTIRFVRQRKLARLHESTDSIEYLNIPSEQS